MAERGILQVWKCRPALPAIIQFQCHSKNSLTGTSSITADEMQNANYATVRSELKKDCWWQLMSLSLVWRRFIHRHSQCHCCCHLQLAEFPLTADYYSYQHWNHHISRLVASDNRKQVSLQLNSQDDCAFCCECSQTLRRCAQSKQNLLALTEDAWQLKRICHAMHHIFHVFPPENWAGFSSFFMRRMNWGTVPTVYPMPPVIVETVDYCHLSISEHSLADRLKDLCFWVLDGVSMQRSGMV